MRSKIQGMEERLFELVVRKFHAVQTFVEETQMVQISKNEAFVVLASSNQPKLKEQFSNQYLAENNF